MIYLFLAALGFCCCMRAFSSCSEWGLFSSCSAWAFHCRGCFCCGTWALGHEGVSSCSHGLSWAPLPCMWDLPKPRVVPVCPALAAKFPTTRAPGRFSPKHFEQPGEAGHVAGYFCAQLCDRLMMRKQGDVTGVSLISP